MTNAAQFEGKVALITGAARGQGREYARRLAEGGADIVGVDITADIDSVPYPMGTEAELDETKSIVEALGTRMITVRGDVRRQVDLDDAVRAALDAFGRIDFAIADAGIYSVIPFWELTEEQWGDVIDVNLSGVWRTCKAVAPHFMEQRRGAIVVVASVSGLEPGDAQAHYCSSKHGVIGLMKTVALELSPYGIRVNAICPSTVDTGMSNWQGAYDMVAGHPGGTREEFVKNTRQWHALPERPSLDPRAMAEATAFLLSDSASAITGVSLPVDAGHGLLPGMKFWD
jgi:SDR family mycofactocin-dependent oxidoreductase